MANITSSNVRVNTSALLLALGLAITLSLSGILLLSLKSDFHHQHATNKPLFLTYSSFVPKKEKNMNKRFRTVPRDNIKPYMIFLDKKNHNNRTGYTIKEEEILLQGHIHNYWLDGDDHLDPYYAFDDDNVRNHNQNHHDCRRVSWHRDLFPTCNTFHETSMFYAEGVSHGHYRNVMKVVDEYAEAGEVVIKVLRVDRGYNHENYENVKNDALVMERLTSSPRIVDVYGHCGSSILQETLVDDIESVVVPGSGYLKHNRTLNDKEDVDPQNKFTPPQKLYLALKIAEAIADLHGFQDGVIVHDDIQLAQFLYNKQNKLKLNDFNRAEIMLWSESKGEYCKYRNGKVFGQYRSPEEVDDRYLNEKIDVFSYGNMVYNILTGMWNFYENTDDQVVQRKVSEGETPFIDERYSNHSFEESALVRVIKSCWNYDVDKRADIFEVVDFLNKALEMAKKRHRTQQNQTT